MIQASQFCQWERHRFEREGERPTGMSSPVQSDTVPLFRPVSQ